MQTMIKIITAIKKTIIILTIFGIKQTKATKSVTAEKHII